MLGYALVLHEQLAARPWIAKPHALWGKAAEALGKPIAPSVSIARNQPFFALGAPLANMLALICSFLVCIDRDRARQLIVVIAWSGAGYALYGIATYMTDPTTFYGVEKIAYRDVLTGLSSIATRRRFILDPVPVLWLLLLSKQIRHRLPSGPFIGGTYHPCFYPTLPIHYSAIHDAASLRRSDADDEFQIRRCDFTLGTRSCFCNLFSPRFVWSSLRSCTLLVSGRSVLLVLPVLGGNISGRFDLRDCPMEDGLKRTAQH